MNAAIPGVADRIREALGRGDERSAIEIDVNTPAGSELFTPTLDDDCDDVARVIHLLAVAWPAKLRLDFPTAPSRRMWTGRTALAARS